MSRSISIAPGDYYHLYNRGTERREIFLSTADHERFLTLLYLCNTTEPVRIDNIGTKVKQGSTLLKRALLLPRQDTLVDICAYCLMPNHIHILAREKEEQGISKLMQKLLTGYTMYFNKKYERTGALFQGKFKAAHVDDDRYLKYLVSYIHLNPVKLIDPKWKESGIRDRAFAESHLKNYNYSSYAEYAGLSRPESAIINRDAMPDYFNEEHAFEREIEDWLTCRQET